MAHTFVGKFAAQGSDPGEFANAPARVFFYEQQIVIPGSDKIVFFDSGGNFLRQMDALNPIEVEVAGSPITSYSTPIAIVNDEIISFYSGFFPEAEPTVFFNDVLDGSLKRSVDLSESVTNAVHGTFYKDEIYLSSVSEGVLVVGLDGTVSRKIALFGNNFRQAVLLDDELYCATASAGSEDTQVVRVFDPFSGVQKRSWTIVENSVLNPWLGIAALNGSVKGIYTLLGNNDGSEDTNTVTLWDKNGEAIENPAFEYESAGIQTLLAVRSSDDLVFVRVAGDVDGWIHVYQGTRGSGQDGNPDDDTDPNLESVGDNLSDVRENFINKTGRFDLSAEEANWILNAAQRWLDRRLPHHKSNSWLYKLLESGESKIQFRQVRYLKQVWAIIDGVRVELEKLTWAKIQENYGTVPLPGITAGTPRYWAPLILGLAPEQKNEIIQSLQSMGYTDIDFLQVGNHWPLNGIGVFPPADATYEIHVLAEWYSPSLTNDDQKTYWTVQHPEILIRAAQLQLEFDLRNSEGQNDFVRPLRDDLTEIYHDLVAEEMEGSPEKWVMGD